MHRSRSRGSINQISSSQGSGEEKLKPSSDQLWHQSTQPAISRCNPHILLVEGQIDYDRQRSNRRSQEGGGKDRSEVAVQSGPRTSFSIIDLMGALEENRMV
jgi:hypothetical protein